MNKFAMMSAAAFCCVFGVANSVYAFGTMRVIFGTDPTWTNNPLSPTTPSCKSSLEVETTPGGGNQFPPDSSLTRFTGGIRAFVLGNETAPLGGFIRRGTLSQQEAAGTGFLGGFSDWPNPGVPGELTGMMWPMRDFMNFATTQTIIPGGFDNSERNGGPNAGGSSILGIDGRQDWQRYGLRSNIGNGIDAPMNVFQVEFTATDFTTPRTIRIQFDPGVVEVTSPSGEVFRDIQFLGGFTDIVVPAPSGAALLMIGGVLAARRRR